MSRAEVIRQGLLLGAAVVFGREIKAAGFTPAPSPADKGRAAWLAGKWGIMVHWIAPGPGSEKGTRITDLNQAVDQFDVPVFLRQLEDIGAHHLIFTVGQNTTYYASPNAVLDKYMGPGHSPKRDLVLEIARGMKQAGKRFIAYLPAEIKNDPAMFEAFQWKPKHQEEFERRYTEFIRAYAEQWGEHVDGWWYDGCYTYDDYYVPRDWDLWCKASRAGNKHAAVAFNNGSFVSGFTQPLFPGQDYISGECEGIMNGRIWLNDKADRKRSIPPLHFAEGTNCQFHVLMPIDNNGDWINNKDGEMPPPKYPDAELFEFVKSCTRAGCGVTLNVGIYQDGRLSQGTLEQLRRMKNYL